MATQPLPTNLANQHYDYQCAGVLLINPDGNIIAQLRDDKPGINWPGKASIFAGRLEGNENPKQAALRELAEETNLHLTPGDIEPFHTGIVNTWLDNKPEIHYVFIAKNISTQGLKVYEGQGFVIVKDSKNPRIAGVSREMFAKWFALRDGQNKTA